MERLAKLEATFRQLGIDISEPGFYDSPGFMAQEQRDPEFLVRYAEFVNLRRATPEYEAFARSQTVKAAAFLHERLVKDGRLELASTSLGSCPGSWTDSVCGTTWSRAAWYSSSLQPPGFRPRISGRSWRPEIPPSQATRGSAPRRSR